MCDYKPLFMLFLAMSITVSTTGNAPAADRSPTEPVGHARPFRLPDRIITLDGKTYKNVILDKVEADGLLVSFAPVEGGSGTAKLKFRNLPVELQEPYGYDANLAAEYESAQARGEAAWRAEHAVRMEQMEAARAEHAAWERQIRAKREEAEQAQAQAEATRRTHDQSSRDYPAWSSGWYSFGGGYGYSSHRRGSRPKNHVPRPLPVVGETSSPISPFMGPMRPFGK